MFERAHGGTLYLDEVADMPRESQSRILRVLVEQRFRRVGGDQDVQVDVRVVSSTSRDLREEIAAGRFREDLFHRLNVVPLRVPGLAERREDIPELVEYFIERLSAASGLPKRRLADDAFATLQVHAWPGNVRQLRNNVERILILAAGDPDEPITADMLPAEASASPPAGGMGAERIIALPLREARELFEREYLDAQIMRFGGNISRTAAFIGMERSALHRKLKSLGFGGVKVEEGGLMRRIAYVNGRFVPHAEAAVHIEDRGYQFADGVYEVWAVLGGRLADSGGPFRAAGAQPGRTAHRHADERGGPAHRAARDGAPQPGPRRPALSAGHPRRRARATTPSPIPRRRPPSSSPPSAPIPPPTRPRR